MKAFSVVFGLLLASGVSRSQQYVVSTIAGGVAAATPVAAPAASIEPRSIKSDTAGNVYFISSRCVFKLDASGVLARIAGNGKAGYSGDGGPATSARVDPGAIAIDRDGNLFIADYTSSRVRKVSTSGIITTVAGNGTFDYSGDGGPATSAQLYFPLGVVADETGSIFILDDILVRKVAASGIITTVAGKDSLGFSGDGGPAINAEFNEPQGIAIDRSGNLFIADTGNYRVRKVSSAGIVTTVAGNGNPGFSGDGGAATNAQLYSPGGIAVDPAGNLFFTDSGRVRKVSAGGIITTVAGNDNPGFSGDGGLATNARLNPGDVAVDGAGNLFIADTGNGRVRKVSASGIITTVAGNGNIDFSGDGGPAANAQFSWPSAIAVDRAGNVFVADRGNQRVRKISTAGIVTTVAGNGNPGFSGDGGPATSAQLSSPLGVALDGAGNLFIADAGNVRVRKVSTSGIITTVAGNGSGGFSGDGGPATSARLNFDLNHLVGMAVDGAGNLYIADSGNSRVRKVSTTGSITTVAGNGVGSIFAESSGDGGPATNAQLGNPSGLAVDVAGNLYISDSVSRVRKVSTSGIITTVVGTGTQGFSGDSGPATNAQLSSPRGIAVDAAGNLFIADTENGRVRMVNTSGTISTVGEFPYYVHSVAVNQASEVYFDDDASAAILLLKPANQFVLINSVVDAASQAPVPVSPGKIVVIYGAGLGPSQLVVASPSSGVFGTQLGGTKVSFNGIDAPIVYTSATQVSAIVPYATSGATANVVVSYQGRVSANLSVPVAASAPSLFTSNQTGAGQAASINAADGTLNTAANPVKTGDYISLYATGEGQTIPPGVDGKLAELPLPQPNLPVTVTVGGMPAIVQYKGAVFGVVAGLMQVNVQIPSGIQPGGYVPVVLKVGNASTVAGAVWIAVAGN